MVIKELPFSTYMTWFQFGLIVFGVIITIIIVVLVVYDTVWIHSLKKEIFKVVLRMDDENYTLWKKKHKKELENAKLKRLLKKPKKKR